MAESSDDYSKPIPIYSIGELVAFTGYNYSPDYKYSDEDDYDMGIVVRSLTRTYYCPVYVVFWFKNRVTTEVIEDHLSRVVRK